MAGLRGRLRQAAAFVRSTEPRSSPTRLTIILDIVLATAGTVAVLYAVAKTSSHPVNQVLPPDGNPVYVRAAGSGTTWVGWRGALLATMTTVPLAIRRLRPLTAFWVILAAVLATPHYEANVITLIAVVLAAYSAVAYSRFRGVAILSLPAAAILISAAFPSTMPTLPARGTALLVLIPIVIVGNAMHRWRQQAGDSRARLLGLQAEHEAATRRALELERARIASELHDVVTHNVSVMIVQAGAARQVLVDTPDEARTALLAAGLRASGHRASGHRATGHRASGRRVSGHRVSGPGSPRTVRAVRPPIMSCGRSPGWPSSRRSSTG
jgi:signal transduction histidine kinase